MIQQIRYEDFSRLSPPTQSMPQEVFIRAKEIVSDGRAYIGKTSESKPILLVRSSNQPTFMTPTTANIQIKYGQLIRLVDENNDLQEPTMFTTLECIIADANLHECFIKLINISLETMNIDEFDAKISEFIEAFRTLLRNLESASPRKASGLWAELFLINRSSNPEKVAKSWHNSPGDLYDFAIGSQRLEVKSTTIEGQRRHSFSLGQLNPSTGIHITVASLQLRASNAGLSIEDLLDQLQSKLNPGTFLNVYRVATASLGKNWTQGYKSYKYEEHLSSDSLNFYNVQDIPRIEKESIPSAVTDVRFTSDLSSVDPLSVDTMQSYDDLFAAVIPHF